MSSSTIAAKGRRAGRSPWVERLGRAGLVAKGLLYAVVGILAVQVALGGREESPDKDGALNTIAQQPFGRGLLILLALGLASYALWRLAQGFLDRDNEGEDAKGLAKRGGAVAKAAWYFLLAGLTVDRIVSQRRRELERAADDRRRLRPPARPLPRLRRRPRVRRGGGLQRLPRRHVQVQREAEDGRDG